MRPLSKEWIAEARAIGGISASVTVTMLAQLAISAVETFLVARLGTKVLAGVTLALNFYLLVFLVTLGIVTAVTPIAAQACGRGDEDRVRLVGQQGLWVALLVSLPSALVLLICGCIFLDHSRSVEAHSASSYLVGAAFGLPAWVAYVAVRSFAIAAGRVKVTTAIMLAAVPFHLVLTYWLVFGGFGTPALGALGAGIAYSLAAFFAWIILGVILHKSPDDIFKRAFSHPYTWNWPCMKQIIWLGIPFMCRIVLAEGVLPVAGFIIAPFGSVALAGYAVSSRIIDLLSMFSFGFSEAAGIRAGIGAGAKQHELVGSAGWVALQLSLMFNGLFGVALILFPNKIALLFLGSGSLSTLQITDFALPLTAGVLLLGGIHNVIGGALNGLQDAKAPLIATALCAWGVGLPLAFLLSHSMSLPVSGLWSGLLGGDLVAAAIYLFLFVRWLHKLQRHSTVES